MYRDGMVGASNMVGFGNSTLEVQEATSTVSRDSRS